MVEAQRKHELLKRAESLSASLATGGVSRAELRPVLNALFLPAAPWAERLKQAQQLLEALPESWVSTRSGQSRPQLGRVRAAFRPVLKEGLSEEDLKFLLGWTARLVHIKDLEANGR